jgi:polyvinyl alcohol dehydrogenase (cytochrome)
MRSVVVLPILFLLIVGAGQGAVFASAPPPSPVPKTSSPPGGDWTSFTYDYNDSRYNAASNVTASNIPSLKLAWHIPSGYAVTSQPLVLNERVYYADWGGNVICANIVTGSVIWKTNLGAPISSTVALSGGDVYVALSPFGHKEVYALNQATGNIIWHTPLPSTMTSVWASPIIYNGLLYIGTSGSAGNNGQTKQKGELFALNAATGGIVWKFLAMTGTSGGAPIWGSVVIDASTGLLFIGTGDARTNSASSLYSYSILALSASSGTLVWYYRAYTSKATGHDWDFGSSANLFSVKIGGTVYQAVGLGAKDGNYYVLNRANGNLLEKYSVVIGSNSGGIFGLAAVYDGGDGNHPEIFIAGANSATNTGLVSAYLPSNDTAAWSFASIGRLEGSVTLVPGAVLFGSVTGNLYALSSMSGSVLFSTTIPYQIGGGVTVAEGHVLVGDFVANPTVTNPKLGLYAFVPSS